jgi:hypothetical protein
MTVCTAYELREVLDDRVGIEAVIVIDPEGGRHVVKSVNYEPNIGQYGTVYLDTAPEPQRETTDR